MFFRKKRREDEDQAAEHKADRDQDDVTVAGTAPELVEVTDDNPSAKGDGTAVAPPPSDGVRLFSGFEQDDFEVGFRAADGNPALVMRWKDGGEWFAVPALFNRGVLAAIDERDSAADLNRLLRNYGYDVDAVAE